MLEERFHLKVLLVFNLTQAVLAQPDDPGSATVSRRQHEPLADQRSSTAELVPLGGIIHRISEQRLVRELPPGRFLTVDDQIDAVRAVARGQGYYLGVQRQRYRERCFGVLCEEFQTFYETEKLIFGLNSI